MNRYQKELIKVYIGIFVLLGIVASWNSISWLFTYRGVSGVIDTFFNPYQDSRLLVSSQTDQKENAAKAASLSATAHPYSAKPNSLEIPSLQLEVPLVITTTTDEKKIIDDLDKGAVYYPGSVSPGENGQMVVLGHSAPPGWPQIKHDWIFSHIEQLKAGDTIVMHFNHQQYTYKVTEKSIIMPGSEISTAPHDKNNNVLVLVSCWPPGKNYKRIAVQAQLVKN